jgi:hypothetical protein
MVRKNISRQSFGFIFLPFLTAIPKIAHPLSKKRTPSPCQINAGAIVRT